MCPYSIDDFGIELEQMVPNVSVWASSGWSTVTPLPQTVCGVGALYGPPFAAPDATLSVIFEADGHLLVDHAHPEIGDHILCQGGRWGPGRIIRRATYHKYREGKTTSFAIETTLVPTRGYTGYVLALTVRNRGDKPLPFQVHPHFDPGGLRRLAAGDWHYDSPAPGRRAGRLSPRTWGNDEATASLTVDLPAAVVGPGEQLTGHIAVRLEPGLEPRQVIDLAGTTAETSRWWERALRAHLGALPTLHSDVEGLEAYYRRSLMSGLVCLWDSPAFVTRPFLSTGGLDGGNMCAYVWDLCGYAPNLVTMMLGPLARQTVDLLAGIDFNTHYAATLDGSGVGVAYAYSTWSLISLVRALAAHQGIDGRLVYRALQIFADGQARYTPVGDLLDFGSQENLLEMRGAGWEHVVASPNAERAWCLEVIARLAEIYGCAVDSEGLRRQAAVIRTAVRDSLWDENAGWFRCRYPDGHSELVYSVQVFDALRAGACTGAMVDRVISHVRDGAFLGAYGVSSVSIEDEVHYEVGDPDWSGSGAYEGEATTLALTLWELRRGRRAWDVLRRLLWMGGQLAYFPQEHYCQRPDAPSHKRMNVVAGLAGAEAILFGLMGLEAGPDGGLYFDPQPSVGGSVELRGLCFRGRTVDIDLAPGRCRAAVDGQVVHEGDLARATLVAPEEARSRRQ
jgi:Mannosylglycerate hydrolase MGH1-like glycoside hydrolase domain